ncbi:MAG TPA: sigma-70 family RNA polymerase sigma factor [Ktedonobacteraceae bacterium]
MESTLRATGPLGPLSLPGKPERKTRRKKAQVATNEAGVTREKSASAVEETGSSYGYARAASAEALSDVMLVEQTLGGKQEAFAVLVERYKDAVQNLAYRMLSNVTEAEDVTQEVFVRAYTQLATYKPQHKFSTWLLSIASHLAIDQLRRRRFLALPLEDVPFLEWITDLGAGPEQSALAGEQQDEIQAYLQRLHSKYRSVIVLRYWYDFSYEEISSMLKLTPALVKARLHRARELLARYMKENQLQEGEQADVLARG